MRHAKAPSRFRPSWLASGWFGPSWLRQWSVVPTLVLVLGLAAGCGDGDDTAGDDPTPSPSMSEATSQPTETPTESASTDEPSPSESAPTGTVVQVTLKDGQITPNGDRIKADAGEPITFDIDADAAGELHFHSTPEQSIDFEPGTSSYEIVIDQPGIVEVELHEPELLVAQLEIR
jgi:hypothetical protein